MQQDKFVLKPQSDMQTVALLQQVERASQGSSGVASPRDACSGEACMTILQKLGFGSFAVNVRHSQCV